MKVASLLITLLTFERGEEKATPEKNSMEGYTPKNTSGRTLIGGPRTKPGVFHMS
jgi:hypothetical protein